MDNYPEGIRSFDDSLDSPFNRGPSKDYEQYTLAQLLEMERDAVLAEGDCETSSQAAALDEALQALREEIAYRRADEGAVHYMQDLNTYAIKKEDEAKEARQDALNELQRLQMEKYKLSDKEPTMLVATRGGKTAVYAFSRVDSALAWHLYTIERLSDLPKPWVYGKLIKLDGTPSICETQLYDNWEVYKKP